MLDMLTELMNPR